MRTNEPARLTTLDHLDSRLIAVVDLARQWCSERNAANPHESPWSILVIETRRTLQRHCWLYAQGRTKFDKTVHYRQWQKLGSPTMPWAPARAQVTWTFSNSKHLTDQAVDFTLVIGDRAIWGTNAKGLAMLQALMLGIRDAIEATPAYDGVRNLGISTGKDWFHWEV